jgi:hypothetical protein
MPGQVETLGSTTSPGIVGAEIENFASGEYGPGL